MSDPTRSDQHDRTDPPPEQAKAGTRAWLGLVVLALAAMMHGTDSTIAAIAAPRIGADLNTSLHQLQWVTTGYMVAYAALLILAGKLGDRLGHRKVFLAGMIGFVAASLLVGLATNIVVLVLFRIAQGACGAFMLPSSLALVRLTFPDDSRKMAMGIFTGVFAISAAAGPVLGGLLVGLAGWRWAFFVNVAVGVLLFPGVVAFVRNARARERDEHLDVVGVVLFALAMSAAVLAINRSGVDGWEHPAVWGGCLVFVGAGAWFVIRLPRVSHPLIPWSEFPKATMLPAWFVILLGSGLMASVWFYTPLFLQNVQHRSPLMAGLMMLPIAVAGVVGAVVGGGVNQKLGPRVPMVAGSVLFIIALVGLSRLTPTSSYAALWPWLALCGLGLNSLLPTAMEVTVGSVKERLSGIASASGETMGSLGPALGVSASAAAMAFLVHGKVAGADVPAGLRATLAGQADQIAQGTLPAAGSPGEQEAVAQVVAQVFTGSMTTVFWVSAVLLVPAVIVALTLKRSPEEARCEIDEEAGS